MADAPAYLIANLHVEDESRYNAYEKGFFPILKRHEGQFFTYDDKPETLEGESPRSGRMVIFSFPSEKHAKAWFNDPEYQALAEHRRAGSKLQFLTLVHGLPPRS